jgi:SAM-dependent methyltransferase
MARSAEWWDQQYARAERVLNRPPHRLVAELVSELPPGRALDLGAGEGRNAVWLAAQGWQVTAVDFSRVAIEWGRESAADLGVELDWVLQDIHSPLPAGPFDLVLVIYVHPDEDQRRGLFRSLPGVLVPGGHVLVIGRDLADLDAGHAGPSDPDRLYTPERLRDAFPGVELERCESVQRAAEPSDERPPPVDTLAWGRLA